MKKIITYQMLKNQAFKLGADLVGIIAAESAENTDKFLTWLNKDYAGEMHYLLKNREERFDPTKLLHGAKSIISVAVNHYPAADDFSQMKSPYKVAKYAWGEDYHYVIGRMLEKLRSEIKKLEPKLESRICIDTAPFMDKFWAQKAGLGWQGKHSVLVSRSFGCWLNIGALIINIPLDKYDAPHKNHCGNCTACIDACPTGALVEPYVLDATKCISYWTIESKCDKIPDKIKKNLNNWVFGCDICLDACPFNRFAKPRKNKDIARNKNMNLIESGKLINLTESEFNYSFKFSNVKRTGLKRLKRNIMANKTKTD